jgi:hypothetical protein
MGNFHGLSKADNFYCAMARINDTFAIFKADLTEKIA